MARKRIDISGEKYGRWTAIKEVEQRGNVRYYLCECKCGTKKEVSMTSLRAGGTFSCGCAIKTRPSDLTDKKFDRLTAISPTNERRNKKVVWRCKCKCGNYVNVLSTYLTNGDTRSCGCLKKEQDNKNLRDSYDNKYVENVNTSLLKSKLRSDNKSGVKGVGYNVSNDQWEAYIGYGGRQIYLGSWADKRKAIAARKRAEEKYHKPFLEEGQNELD